MLIKSLTSLFLTPSRNQFLKPITKLIMTPNIQKTKCYGFFNVPQYTFSKLRIMEEFQDFQKQLEKKDSLLNSIKKAQKQNQFLQKQQKIVKDFLELTEESFNLNLQQELKQKYHIDAQMLLMILSSLQDPKVIRQNLPKLYPFVSIFEKPQLMLLFQLIITYKPETLPPLMNVTTRPLEDIQSILLILSTLYKKQEKLIEWLKEIPLYKGTNICMIATGFFSIYQTIDQHVRFKNQKLIKRCMDRILQLAIDENEQTKISIAIIGLESKQTSQFSEQLLIELENIDYSQVDPFKLQLFFIYLHKHLSQTYSEVRKQVKSKTKYKILEESEQGQITEKQEQEYQISSENGSVPYEQISQIQKFKYLNSIAKKTLLKIMDLNWKQSIKLNLLLDYWKLFQTFQNAHPFNRFQSRLIDYTLQRQIIRKLTNLTADQIIQMLEIMQRLKINKSQLLIRLLALLSQKLQILESNQLIRLSRVCVTFVRQCQDYLIGLRREIQNRKFIFSDQQIEQLNQIYKRVVVLFPRPLVK